MTERVIVTDEGPIRTVRINRPDKKNALTTEMYAAMAQAVETADQNSAIRCIRIAGAPGAFCAGNDLQDFLAAATGGNGLGEPVARFMYAMVRAQKPLLAAVDGLAVGIGTTMLMHCDYVVAGEGSRFSTPFVPLGIVPEFASSLIAPRLMGQRRAFSLLVMARPMDAQAAREAGIVNAVVPSTEVESASIAAARDIAALPPEALAISRAMLRGDPGEIVRRIEEEMEIYKIRLKSSEARGAFEAFLNRKK